MKPERTEPIPMKAGDKRVMVNGEPVQVDFRIISEELYQELSQSSPVESNRKIEIAIAEFERLKSLAGTLRDIIYLDGVLAVLDTIKNDQFVPPIEETKEK